ncbi:MAG: hypothetical protein LBR11_02995 [Deltaproteobacteria bacterium]|jgi:hypothetical protein|nr:hypothetical protein [Deltaproteobacteria bacterium]
MINLDKNKQKHHCASKDIKEEYSFSEILDRIPLSPYKLSKETEKLLLYDDEEESNLKEYDNIKDLCKALGI